jgi:hypothetical protein
MSLLLSQPSSLVCMHIDNACVVLVCLDMPEMPTSINNYEVNNTSAGSRSFAVSFHLNSNTPKTISKSVLDGDVNRLVV